LFRKGGELFLRSSWKKGGRGGLLIGWEGEGKLRRCSLVRETKCVDGRPTKRGKGPSLLYSGNKGLFKQREGGKKKKFWNASRGKRAMFQPRTFGEG